MAGSKAGLEYLESVENRLEADGCAPQWEAWDGDRALVGRRADFRIRWMATRLHLFIIARVVPEITVQITDAFTLQALKYARKNKSGLPVGWQNGVAVFPVLVSDVVEPAAAAWAAEKQRFQFASFARPVVVDVGLRQVSYYGGSPLLGGLYASHLIEKSERYFYFP